MTEQSLASKIADEIQTQVSSVDLHEVPDLDYLPVAEAVIEQIRAHVRKLDERTLLVGQGSGISGVGGRIIVMNVLRS